MNPQKEETMTLPPSDAWRLLSVLLHYPDDSLLQSLEEIAAAVGRLPESGIKTAAAHFFDYLGSHTPIRLQENFTAAFDMCPDTTLNLTYHAYSDNDKRAAALVRLQQIYDQAGWVRITGELPDYLPLMLEFLSIHPRPEKAIAVWQCLQGTGTLVAGLEKGMPAYAGLLRPLARMALAINERPHAGAGSIS